jgi:hypothetical protein
MTGEVGRFSTVEAMVKTSMIAIWKGNYEITFLLDHL